MCSFLWDFYPKDQLTWAIFGFLALFTDYVTDIVANIAFRSLEFQYQLDIESIRDDIKNEGINSNFHIESNFAQSIIQQFNNLDDKQQMKFCNIPRLYAQTNGLETDWINRIDALWTLSMVFIGVSTIVSIYASFWILKESVEYDYWEAKQNTGRALATYLRVTIAKSVINLIEDSPQLSIVLLFFYTELAPVGIDCMNDFRRVGFEGDLDGLDRLRLGVGVDQSANDILGSNFAFTASLVFSLILISLNPIFYLQTMCIHLRATGVFAGRKSLEPDFVLVGFLIGLGAPLFSLVPFFAVLYFTLAKNYNATNGDFYLGIFLMSVLAFPILFALVIYRYYRKSLFIEETTTAMVSLRQKSISGKPSLLKQHTVFDEIL